MIDGKRKDCTLDRSLPVSGLTCGRIPNTEIKSFPIVFLLYFILKEILRLSLGVTFGVLILEICVCMVVGVDGVQLK